MHCSKWKISEMKETIVYCAILARVQIWRCSSDPETPDGQSRKILPIVLRKTPLKIIAMADYFKLILAKI
jgi:hypothetical protein